MRPRLTALTAIAALCVTACAGSTETTNTPAPAAIRTPIPTDGSTIVVGSFDFPESEVLGELMAQTLERHGYPVERKFNLGSREVVFPALESGEIGLIAEYLGSALIVGFGREEVPAEPTAAMTELRAAFEEIGQTLLASSEAEDKNVFVVTTDYADEHDLTTIGDLAGVDGAVTLGGPPECEERDTCFKGLVETYGLDNLEFESIGESAARNAALEAGDIDVNVAFSTQPVIDKSGWVVLEDDEGLIPPENIVAVISTALFDEYGIRISEILNDLIGRISTPHLRELNGLVEDDGEDAADVAAVWIADNLA